MVVLRESPSQSSQLPLRVESLNKKNKIAQPSFERHSEGHNIGFQGAKQTYETQNEQERQVLP